MFETPEAKFQISNAKIQTNSKSQFSMCQTSASGMLRFVRCGRRRGF
jgi:hypothetical protein